MYKRQTLAGVDTVALADKYGTPLYLMNEKRIRENMRLYKNALARCFGDGSYPLYASKAVSYTHLDVYKRQMVSRIPKPVKSRAVQPPMPIIIINIRFL